MISLYHLRKARQARRDGVAPQPPPPSSSSAVHIGREGSAASPPKASATTPRVVPPVAPRPPTGLIVPTMGAASSVAPSVATTVSVEPLRLQGFFPPTTVPTTRSDADALRLRQTKPIGPRAPIRPTLTPPAPSARRSKPGAPRGKAKQPVPPPRRSNGRAMSVRSGISKSKPKSISVSGVPMNSGIPKLPLEPPPSLDQVKIRNHTNRAFRLNTLGQKHPDRPPISIPGAPAPPGGMSIFMPPLQRAHLAITDPLEMSTPFGG